MTYRFTDNLQKLSHSENHDEIIREWELVNDRVIKGNGNCICNAHMKNIYYFMNSITGEVIQVAEKCKQKFNTAEGANALKNIVDKWFTNFNAVVYIQIEDLFAYSNDNLNRLIGIINSRITETSTLDDLYYHKSIIMSLLAKYHKNKIFVEALELIIKNTEKFITQGEIIKSKLEIAKKLKAVKPLNATLSKEKEYSKTPKQLQQEKEALEFAKYIEIKNQKEALECSKYIEIKNHKEKNLEEQKKMRGELCGCNIPKADLCFCSNPHIIFGSHCINCKGKKCRCTMRKKLYFHNPN